MTNINCADNCVHQKDGKCMLGQLAPVAVADVAIGGNACPYLIPRKKGK